jgi:hypothetical protein
MSYILLTSIQDGGSDAFIGRNTVTEIPNEI